MQKKKSEVQVDTFTGIYIFQQSEETQALASQPYLGVWVEVMPDFLVLMGECVEEEVEVTDRFMEESESLRSGDGVVPLLPLPLLDSSSCSAKPSAV